MSSPRTWGCFFAPEALVVAVHVFPTHVGVFLTGLPDPRGLNSSSPRTWGCFLSPQTKRQIQGVFPTHVGVFLLVRLLIKMTPSLPHARGGVSRSGRACPVLALSSPRTWGGRQAGVAPESPFPTVGAFHVCP